MLEEGKFVADRYEILARVGAGGMSDVYEAMDHVLSRTVAIKVLKQEFADDVNFVTKFRTEAQSAAGLEHPNIVNIYDVGSEDGFHYIVMEYVEGITLKTYIEKKQRLSYKEAISIAIQVGRGIEAAHNKNIVHRDIKPQNIMISTEGKVKVTDFGIARAATSNTIHSDVMGSVHYSSPEQARNGFVDNKSDIYSLGIVMYEMVTGKVPFDGDTTVAIAIQHLQEEMPSPRSYVPELPVSLEKIILKCTQKSADRRYPVMGELLDDLKHALVNPDEDFVVMQPATIQDKTRVISQTEVAQIKESAAAVRLDEEEVEPMRMRRRQEPPEEEDEEAEEDEGGFLNPKMEKAMTIMGIVAAVIILLIVIYLAGSMFGAFKFGPLGTGKKDPGSQQELTTSDHELSDTDPDKNTKKTSTDDKDKEDSQKKAEMIELRGKEPDEARKALKEIGLELFTKDKSASDVYPKGQIMDQDIEKGEMVAKGTVVQVTVSTGPAEFGMPGVIGESFENAKNILQGAGLAVNNPEYHFSEQPEGIVIDQNPGNGAMVRKGAAVTLYVSKGLEKQQVPDIRNQSEEDAVRILAEHGLEKGGVSSEYHDTIEEGKVVSQSPQPQASVDKGSSVDFVVSLGKKEVFYQMESKTIGMPENSELVVSANIQLLDANGEAVKSWNGVAISSFPYTVSAKDITTSSGTLVIDWILEDGGADTQEIPVQFKEQ